MEVKEGYIVKDGAVPLLASTEKLLDLLGYAVPGLDSSLLNGLRPKEEPEINTTLSQNDYASYQSLKRVQNSVNLLIGALYDIQQFKHRDYNRPQQPHNRESHTERKHKALEQQRQRLLAGKDDTETTLEDRELNVVRALNSLCLVTPILLTMLHHAKRNDRQLDINGTKLEATKLRSCWLLGEYVYDIISIKSSRNVLRTLQNIYVFFGLNEVDVNLESDIWKETLSRSMQDLVNKKVCDIGKHPFENLEGDAKAKAVEFASQLDTQFGLAEDAKDKEEHEKYLKSIQALHDRIEAMLKESFPDCRLSIYGSCLADLSLGKHADVDLSLHIQRAAKCKEDFDSGTIPVNKYHRQMKHVILQVCRKMEGSKEFRNMHPVTRARVPVVTGTWVPAENPHTADGTISFDICLLNDIAVVNSSLLREYAEVDPRAKQLMIAVKKWAKENAISSAKNNSISSYAWMNLVIFYLQCLDFVPNLQSRDLYDKAGFTPDKENYWHTVDNLETSYLTWEQAKQVWSRPQFLDFIAVSALLYGFFRFYAFEFGTFHMVSIKRGQDAVLYKTVFPRASLFLTIEDPFETYDAHIRHDLGMPASEAIAAKIVKCLKTAAEYLQDAFSKSELLQKLWPEPISDDTQQGESKRGARRKGGAGHVAAHGNAEALTGTKDSEKQKRKANNSQEKINAGTVSSVGASVGPAEGSKASNVSDKKMGKRQNKAKGKRKGSVQPLATVGDADKKDDLKAASTDNHAPAVESGGAAVEVARIAKNKNRQRRNNRKGKNTASDDVAAKENGANEQMEGSGGKGGQRNRHKQDVIQATSEAASSQTMELGKASGTMQGRGADGKGRQRNRNKQRVRKASGEAASSQAMDPGNQKQSSKDQDENAKPPSKGRRHTKNQPKSREGTAAKNGAVAKAEMDGTTDVDLHKRPVHGKGPRNPKPPGNRIQTAYNASSAD